jgi:hypothetical protein
MWCDDYAQQRYAVTGKSGGYRSKSEKPRCPLRALFFLFPTLLAQAGGKIPTVLIMVKYLFIRYPLSRGEIPESLEPFFPDREGC